MKRHSEYIDNRLEAGKEGIRALKENNREMFKVIIEQEKELIPLRMIARRAKNVLRQYNHYVIMMSDDVGKLETLIEEWENEINKT